MILAARITFATPWHGPLARDVRRQLYSACWLIHVHFFNVCVSRALTPACFFDHSSTNPEAASAGCAWGEVQNQPTGNKARRVRCCAALATTVTIYKKLPYDPSKDFAPLALITRIPFLLVVNPSLPVNSVTDLIKLAKKEPGRLSYASGGPGSPHHLFTELFKSMTGIQMLHVPYKGSAPALNDVVAGQIPLMFGDVVTSLPLVNAGKVRALGVSSTTRIPSAPEIPTIAESGVPGYEGVGWVMIVAPARTPEAVIDRLYAELKSIAALPEIQKQMIELGTIPVDSPPPDVQQRFIDSEIVRWSKVVELAGIAGTQ